MTAPEKPGREIQQARQAAFLKLLPTIQVFTFIDAALLVLYLWHDTNQSFLVGWLVVTVAHCLFWGFFRGSSNRGWLFFYALEEALLFAAFLIAAFPGAPPDKAIVLSAFATGMMSAGGFSKMTIPGPASTFAVTLTVGAVFALSISGLSNVWIPIVLLVGLGLGTIFLVRTLSRNFDARVSAELELGRQKTLVSDLLSDFGESASEGLWETDPDGRLTLVTPRLAALFNAEVEALRGKPLTARENWSALVEKGSAFRNVEVTHGQGHWWSLTGKPLKSGSLIQGWRGVASDVTEQRQRELEMLRLHRYDSLTGLLNRRSFRAMIDDFFLSPQPTLRCLALIDLVEFKDVNESRGHTFGDALLVAVAERLRDVLPDRLVVARLDGDEFALQGIVPESVEASLANLDRLLKRLAEPYTVGGERFEAGFRLGVSFTPDAGTPDQWLRCADLALRSAKTRGRNRVEVYTPSMMESFLERNRLRQDLRGALQRGEFYLEYQPIVDLRGGRVMGFEALVRWHHPMRGLISPSQFIPLAEETEVILDLGLWVLEQACREARGWPAETTVSVNVSGVQLRSGALAEQVLDLLGRLNFEPERLVLEVTESALIKSGTLAQTFSALRTEGVHWALDDFGTGYSSLSYLQDFPFDKLKIDQSFVRALSGSTSSALLSSIVALAQSLGLAITAEGIEQESQRDILRNLGCEFGQGYFFAKPLPAAEVLELLDRVP